MTETRFEVNDDLLREMSNRGKNLLSSARIFEATFGRIIDRLRKGEQVEDYLTAELLQAYRLLATWYLVHDREAGKRIADEVRMWQAAKVKVRYKSQPQPFLDCTEPITKGFNEVHGWFG